MSRIDDWAGIWEVTTEHGTRIVIDAPRGRFMRIPAMGDDGRLNLVASDGRWRRLAMTPAVQVGQPTRLFTSLTEWWDTTTVVSLRRLDPGEVPQEAPRTLDDEEDDGDTDP